jgi:hypothetical protein
MSGASPLTISMRHPAVRANAKGVAEALALEHRRLRQCQRIRLAQLETAARKHAGARTGRLR